MNATDQLQAALAAAREIPGWTVHRLETGSYRVTSPSGIGLVPAALTPDTCRVALNQLDELGLQHDLYHRLTPEPAAPAQPDLFVNADPETETEVPATLTTKTKPATRKARPRVVRFEFPDEPQALPLAELLPDAYQGQGRILVPCVTITGEIAQAFFDLRAEKANRRLRPSNVRKFARLIREGHMCHTHQGIAFNTEGQNCDGQHRMAGLLEVLAEDPTVTIVLDITYNAPPEAASAYDGGANRTNVDRLSVAGIERADKVGPLVRLLYQYEETQDVPRSWKEIPPLDQATLIEWGERYGPDLLASFDAVREPLRGTAMNLNVAAVCRYLALDEWPKSPVDDFVYALGEPTRHLRDSPQRALSRWLNNNQRLGKRVTQQTNIAMFLVAYNDFCEKNERSAMSWRPGDGRLPVPYSPPSPNKKTKG